MKPESHTVDVQSLKREDGIMQTDEEDEEEEATKTIQPPVTVSLLRNSLIYSCLSVYLSLIFKFFNVKCHSLVICLKEEFTQK